MNTRRTTASRVEENDVNEQIPPLVEQVPPSSQYDQLSIRGKCNEVPVVPPNMTNEEIREDIFALARVIITHVTRGIDPREDALGSNMTSRLGDFVTMNPPIFLFSKGGENPQ